MRFFSSRVAARMVLPRHRCPPATRTAARTIGTLAGGTGTFSPALVSLSSIASSANPERRWFFSTTGASSSSSSSLTSEQIRTRLNEFQDLFVEARLCIDDVKDSIGTVYFEDDADEAREAVDTAIRCFETLLEEITDPDERNKILRSNGLKVEQLKGELELTLGQHDDHH